MTAAYSKKYVEEKFEIYNGIPFSYSEKRQWAIQEYWRCHKWRIIDLNEQIEAAPGHEIYEEEQLLADDTSPDRPKLPETIYWVMGNDFFSKWCQNAFYLAFMMIEPEIRIGVFAECRHLIPQEERVKAFETILKNSKNIRVPKWLREEMEKLKIKLDTFKTLL